MDINLRRFAVFVDGLSRAVILPFGPALVFRLLGDAALPWSSISIRLALTIAAFTAGHFMGELVAEKVFLDKRQYHVQAAQVGGVALTLHLFSWGSGFKSVWVLALVRFFYAFFVGMLTVIGTSDAIALTTKTTETLPLIGDCDTDKLTKSNGNNVDATVANAKIYMTGFAVSVLTAGLFYEDFSSDETLQKLTSTHWSPIFFVGSSVILQMILRGAFIDTTTRSPRGVRFHRDQEAPESDSDFRRQRTASATSVNSAEFFDCISEDGDTAAPIQPTEFESEENEVARYVNGKCCYADGSPAFVTPGDSAAVIPVHYLENCSGDRKKAMKMWQDTQQFRNERSVWKIHTMPNPFYRDIVKAYPHFPHGFNKDGLAVMYEQPGKMNLRALFQGECTIEDMVHHYLFTQEYLNNCICTKAAVRKAAGKEGQPYSFADYGIMVVMDIGGAGISMMSTDVIRYLTAVSAISQAHYPLSTKRVCVVNCPFFASGVFSQIKKILPPNIQADLFSASGVKDGLQQYIDEDQIPAEYGGTSPYKLGEHPYAKELAALVDSAANGGDSEEPIVSTTPDNLLEEKIDNEPKSEEELKPILPKPGKESTDVDLSVRRRTGYQVDEESTKEESRPIADGGVDVDSLAFVWFFSACWSGVQGAIEIAVPLWLSTPANFGGLGYLPLNCGKTMLYAALLSLAMMTIPPMSSKLKQRDPIKSLRIGLLLESAALLGMTLISLKPSMDPERINFSLVLLLALGAVASMLGRSGSTSLSMRVADGFSSVQTSDPSSVCSVEYLISHFSHARASKLLTVVSEVIGLLLNSQVWVFAVDRVKPTRFDGALCLFLPSLLTGCLYFLSRFLREKSMPKARANT